MDFGLAAADSREELDDLEFAGGVDPDLAGGSAKESPPLARIDFHVGRERIGPQYRIGGHWRTAKSAESEG
jgi:hypothetical protein